jgi:hypothetical protein
LVGAGGAASACAPQRPSSPSWIKAWVKILVRMGKREAYPDQDGVPKAPDTEPMAPIGLFCRRPAPDFLAQG